MESQDNRESYIINITGLPDIPFSQIYIFDRSNSQLVATSFNNVINNISMHSLFIYKDYWPGSGLYNIQFILWETLLYGNLYRYEISLEEFYINGNILNIDLSKFIYLGNTKGEI